MTYCNQCGSTSFDEAGFCRGCGVRLPGYSVTEPQSAPSTRSQSLSTIHYSKPPGIVLPDEAPVQSTRLSGLWGFVQPDVKNVWVAVVLALVFGPFGMTYSTYLGAFVMFVVTLLAYFFIRNPFVLLMLPVIYTVWAGLAAKSANSIY